jgi:AcrR family transcriptional regulator
MPRSGKEARERLVRAALELFLERGFDAVTVA